MKKSILELGKALDKAEQKEIKGGCFPRATCWQDRGKCCISTARGRICDFGRCIEDLCRWYA